MNKKARIWYWIEYWENLIPDKIVQLAFVWENSRKQIAWLALKERSFRARNPSFVLFRGNCSNHIFLVQKDSWDKSKREVLSYVTAEELKSKLYNPSKWLEPLWSAKITERLIQPRLWEQIPWVLKLLQHSFKGHFWTFFLIKKISWAPNDLPCFLRWV